MFDHLDNIINILTSINVVSSLIGVGGIWGFGKLLWPHFLPIINAPKWRKLYIKKNIGDSWSFLEKENMRLYIDTKFQDTDPGTKDELSEGVSNRSRSLVDYFINDIFINAKKNDSAEKRRFLVLAGSGMGKTTLMIHLFYEYINKFNEKTLPFPIHFLSLVSPNIIDLIDKILDKEAYESILLLDSLDENREACSDFENFFELLDQHTHRFKYVIITCRTQFFPDESSIIKSGSILTNSIAGGCLEYERKYLSPFTKKDINLFLSKKYYGDKEKKIKANDILNSYSSFAARPLLLNYMDYLIDESTYSLYSFNVYEKIVGKWLEREAKKFKGSDKERDLKSQRLFQLSLKLAIKIYENWKDYGISYVSQSDYKSFLIEYGVDDSVERFRDRSLLNRTPLGEIKFAHKSFFEYFLAKAVFEDPRFCGSAHGLSFAYKVWDDLSMSSIGCGDCYSRLTLKTNFKDSDIVFDELKELNRSCEDDKMFFSVLCEKILPLWQLLLAQYLSAYVLFLKSDKERRASSGLYDILSSKDITNLLKEQGITSVDINNILKGLSSEDKDGVEFRAGFRSMLILNRIAILQDIFSNFSDIKTIRGSLSRIIFPLSCEYTDLGDMKPYSASCNISNYFKIANRSDLTLISCTFRAGFVDSPINYVRIANVLFDKFCHVHFMLPSDTSIDQMVQICAVIQKKCVDIKSNSKKSEEDKFKFFHRLIVVSNIIDNSTIEFAITSFGSVLSEDFIRRCIEGQIALRKLTKY